MGCDIMIYEATYSNNGNIDLKYLDVIRGYDFIDYLPIDIVNNGFFEISGEVFLHIFNEIYKNTKNVYGINFKIDETKDYMISISY